MLLLAVRRVRRLSTGFVFEDPRWPNLLLYLFQNGPIRALRRARVFLIRAKVEKRFALLPGLRNEQENMLLQLHFDVGGCYFCARVKSKGLRQSGVGSNKSQCRGNAL
jgi:hypothetical protein